jgi:hypothetical protein
VGRPGGAQEIRDRITKHQEFLRTGLAYIEAAQTYGKRKTIKLTDLELREFVEIVKSEIMLVPVDAFLVDAFLEREDQRAKVTRWRRVLRAWKEPRLLQEAYARFTQAAKMAMYPEGGHIMMREEIDERAVAERKALPSHRERGQHAHDPVQGERVEAGGEGVADSGGRRHDPPHEEEAVAIYDAEGVELGSGRTG